MVEEAVPPMALAVPAVTEDLQLEQVEPEATAAWQEMVVMPGRSR
jgi:hypothetical protein